MANKNHQKQINIVIDYIHNNLATKLNISILCELTTVSTYHFHRIFSNIIGEPLAKYIARKRIEKAALLLLADDVTSITNIAYDCGFSTTSIFCRNFKCHFGMTAQEYRTKKSLLNSKNSQLISKKSDNDRPYSHYFCLNKTIKIGDKSMECKFEIKNISTVNIIYCRHYGAYDQMHEAYGKLMEWAYPRGLVGKPGNKMISVYHDNPNVTTTEKLVSDAGMIVKEPIKTDGEIGQYEINAGLYAVGSFEIAMEEFPAAWNAIYELIDKHGCQYISGHHYEIYNNNRDEHPEKKWFVDICIPVKTK